MITQQNVKAFAIYAIITDLCSHLPNLKYVETYGYFTILANGKKAMFGELTDGQIWVETDKWLIGVHSKNFGPTEYLAAARFVIEYLGITHPLDEKITDEDRQLLAELDS